VARCAQQDKERLGFRNSLVCRFVTFVIFVACVSL